MAYHFDNLFLSCQLCNQGHKKNYFPLALNSIRALSHNDNVSTETPLFIDIAYENPEDFIGFNEEVPFAIDGNIRGKETIKKLGLDRELLNEQRRTTLNRVRTIYKLAKSYPETPQHLKKQARDYVKGEYEKSLQDSTEYASMLRCFFKANPIDF